jgi:hypothetical protein
MSSVIEIEDYSKKNILVRLLDIDQFDKWDRLLSKVNANWNKSSQDPGWIVKKDMIDLLEHIIDDHGSRPKRKSSRDRSGYKSDKKSYSKHKKNSDRSDISDDREEESDSDDELIQLTLARRFKSESSGKIINEEDIANSDEEDVVSHSRRLRHLYRTIRKLQDQVNDLQEKLKN